MKLLSSARLSLVMIPVCLFGLAQGAGADDELLVYVFKGGLPVSAATVSVDGVAVGETKRDGSLLADLIEGGHVIAVEAGGKRQSVRVASNSGQLVDIALDIDSEDGAKVDVYSGRESAAERRGKSPGTLQVKVTRDGTPVEGAVVSLSNGGGITSSNAQGVATANAPRGRYTLTIDGQQYDVRVFAGVARGASVALASDSVDVAVAAPVLEEVFVLGSFDPTAFEVSERDTDGIVDTIGAELLARFSDSDVAASVVRVPGISVQDNKYIFIRGLGGRYVAATLNNSTMPSTNPAKRTVPLDLFPSSFVTQLDIKTTFLPYMPGESTGGNLVINTKTFPDEPLFNISVGSGFLGGLTSENVAIDPLSGEFDALGWDDGTRERDAGVFAISQVLGLGRVSDSAGNSFELNDTVEGELRRAGAILIKDGFDIDTKTAQPNASLGVEYGDLFYVGDAELGFYAAANYSNDWRQRDNGQRFSYTPTGERQDDLRYNILFLGPTGAGKSNLINMMFNQKVVESAASAVSITRHLAFIQGTCTYLRESTTEKKELTVIDTIGFCDSIYSPEQILSLIKSGLQTNLVHLDKVVVVCSGRIEATQAKAGVYIVHFDYSTSPPPLESIFFPSAHRYSGQLRAKLCRVYNPIRCVLTRLGPKLSFFLPPFGIFSPCSSIFSPSSIYIPASPQPFCIIYTPPWPRPLGYSYAGCATTSTRTSLCLSTTRLMDSQREKRYRRLINCLSEKS